eukprot:1148294-Pelagomonas_calceolata.AAC.1
MHVSYTDTHAQTRTHVRTRSNTHTHAHACAHGQAVAEFAGWAFKSVEERTHCALMQARVEAELAAAQRMAKVRAVLPAKFALFQGKETQKRHMRIEPISTTRVRHLHALGVQVHREDAATCDFAGMHANSGG